MTKTYQVRDCVLGMWRMSLNFPCSHNPPRPLPSPPHNTRYEKEGSRRLREAS